LVNDNSGDTDDVWPNGTEILHTYQQAQNHKLTKMPSIPSSSDIVSKKLNKQAIFLGCNDASKVTIVWLPNQKWTYDSNVATSQFQFTVDDTAAMIKNGNGIATQGGDKQWPVCLACAIMHKSARYLPKECKACLEKYCVSG
jgi:lysophospholipase